MDTTGQQIEGQGELTSHDTMLLMEARHLVKKSLEAGVPREVIENCTDQNKFFNYSMSLGDGGGMQPSEVFKFIMAARQKWAYSGSFIVIDGPLRDSRDYIAQMFLYRGIVAYAKMMGRLGATISMSEIMSLFLDMPSERSAACHRLTAVPCLWIKDVHPTGGFMSKSGSDGKVLFDGMLSGRELGKRPTIITIDGLLEDIRTQQDDDHGKGRSIADRYGRKFADVVKTKIASQDSAWRFRGKDSK